MGENKNKQTWSTGDVYVHPRSDAYRKGYERIFGKEEEDTDNDE